MIYILLMIFTGCMLAMQPPINAALGRVTGMLEGAVINFIVGMLILSVLAVFFGKGNILKAAHVPWWQLAGGFFGALMVFSAMISVPRVGALATMLAMILGNLFMGALIDNYGWFGVPVHSFGINRLVGFGLVLAGLFFIVRQ